MDNKNQKINQKINISFIFFNNNYMTTLKLEDISLKIDGKQVLKNINLELKPGQITTLIGPNGGGKTSIARIIIGALQPQKGKVIFGKKIKIGYMPQKITIDQIIPLRVVDFLKLSLEKIVFDSFCEELIERLNLHLLLKRQIHDLSGGQLQKVIFLKSIINNPNLLVLDEPTQYMDVNATEKFYEIIEEIRKKKNCAILLISHDLYMVMQKTDWVFCVNHHICCQGTAESVNNHPEYLSLFGNKHNLAIYQHHHDHVH
jgi:zinc transport system ATP-binding protein